MSEIRTWFENYVIFQKLTDPVWHTLRGTFTNRELRAVNKQQARRAISRAKRRLYHETD